MSQSTVTTLDKGPAAKEEHYDVIVVGAGISGIDMAYRVQTELSHLSYRIFEGRQSMGGTWDLFKYPGVRSDSDMFTLGFPFRPWPKNKPIGEGHEILEYVKETASMFGIDEKISFGRMVTNADWDSATKRWTVTFDENGQTHRATCRFLTIGAGYYDYDQGFRPEFDGEENFKGEILHQQKWQDNEILKGKKVVVVGSGATAITVLPSMAEMADHVTMLQRSPSYIAPLPKTGKFTSRMRKFLPGKLADKFFRWQHIFVAVMQYRFLKKNPETGRKVFRSMAKRKLKGTGIDVDVHFKPKYDPWDQRVCLDPNGVFFDALKTDKADVVTDEIARFDETGIQLKSGEHIETDLVFLATGLNIKMFGGIALTVDGREEKPGDHVVYRGVMADGIPNCLFMVGYINSSWTLRIDLVAEYFCRIVKYMEKNGHEIVAPMNPPADANINLLEMDSGYISRAEHLLPKQGQEEPWRYHQNYFLDMKSLKFSTLDDGVLTFDPAAFSGAKSGKVAMAAE